jgi:DNA (cytosine-5)-methyltransferase 1
LFDGSGGFPLAGRLCDIEPVWAAEVEPYPIAVTTSRFPKMKHLGSVTEVNGAEVEPVDVITFGSPCQDLSVAGKRAGLKHTENGDDETTRSGLFMEAIRIIKEMREATNGVYPRFAVWENVPGAFSSNKGEDFRIVLEEFIKVCEPTAVMPEVPKSGWPYADSYCGDGWSLAYRVFDAQFWGVPQRRRRIYLVADFRGQCAGEVSFKREGVRGYFETGRTPWKETAGDAESGIGAADCSGEFGIINAIGGNAENYQVNTRMPTLTNANAPGFVNAIVYAIDQQGGKGGANYAENVMPTLCSDSHGTPHAVAYEENAYALTTGSFMQVTEEVAPTLMARDWKDPTCVATHYIVRRLTPTECARLQGFADRWGNIDQKDSFSPEEVAFWHEVRNLHAAINGKKVQEYTEAQMLTWYNKLHTDSAEYKMWGNGIALPCALYVMQGIADALKED